MSPIEQLLIGCELLKMDNLSYFLYICRSLSFIIFCEFISKIRYGKLIVLNKTIILGIHQFI